MRTTAGFGFFTGRWHGVGGASLLAVMVLLTSCTTILRSAKDLNLPPSGVVLTLDDGPSETEGVDDRILDVLKANQVKACFCLLTDKLKGKGGVLRRILEEGHTIAFHSKHHEPYLTKSAADFQKDLAEFNQEVSRESGIGFQARFFRPPVGVLSLPMVAEVGRMGLSLLYASHNPTDTFVNAAASSRYTDALMEEVVRMGGGVVVLHNGSELFPRPGPDEFARLDSPANRSWIAPALETIIVGLKHQGFRFLEVDTLTN